MEESNDCGSNYTVQIPFNSITTEFELYCNQGHQKEFLQSIVLFASTIISTIIMFFQNRFGSKNILIFTYLFIAVPSFIFTILVSGLYFKVAGVIGMWLFKDVCFALSTVFYNELLVEPYRNFSNVFFRIVHCSGAIFGTLMTYYLTDYKYIICLYFLVYSIFAIILIFGFPSSPSYLLKQNKTKDLSNAIVKIAKINEYPQHLLSQSLTNLENIIESNLKFFYNILKFRRGQ